MADDLATAERLLDAVAAGLRADRLADDVGSLLAVGRLRIRLDAAHALAADGAADEAAPFARGLLLDIARAFPTRVAWRADAADELLHRHHAAIGHALLTGGRAL